MEWSLDELAGGAGQAFVQYVADLFTWALVAELILLTSLCVFLCESIRSRRFRCPLVGREVEVKFAEHGLPGFRWGCTVQSCTAFDPPTAMTCSRACVDSQFRVRGVLLPLP